jgi:hypothetical protein
MITEDRVKDVAKAIEQAHYPTSKNVTGQAFMGDARTFIAALNAAEGIAKDDTPAPAEFGFADDDLVWSAPAEGAPTEAAKGVLTFTAQPKDGDGFSIGKTRYEFHVAGHATTAPSDIVIGSDLPATIKAAALAINGSLTSWPGDPFVTALVTAPDVITVTAKEPGEPLLPVQTVTWSKMLTPEEKAMAERVRKADEAKPSVTGGPLLGRDFATDPVTFVPPPSGKMLMPSDPTAPPPPFVPPPNVAPEPSPSQSTFAPTSPSPIAGVQGPPPPVPFTPNGPSGSPLPA